MARVGYARVSSVGQSLAVQLDKLAACDKIYQEKMSGSASQRPRLEACLEYVREGDTLVVTRLDRLARTNFHLCQIAEVPQRKGVDLQVLDQQISTTDATGRLLFNMLGAIAQVDTEIRAARQRDGIVNAKARGVPFGRHRAFTRTQVAALHAQHRDGTPIRTLMREFRISKATVYRYLRQGHPEQQEADHAR